ncbi:hypothetical protein FHS31_001942 [Sphingomonas vulcanisoli]|uniref:DUF429 domain-containing protein n=1 Tax=Sphingomonas vulcanisoli TaxID=1658060 RepID=A0ABX0TVD7_9SPHN|nr:hypothetical protein [Sphingomonas vulcanisoli]
MSRFTRFVAIDWSGAKSPYQRGITVAECGLGETAPMLVAPPGRAWSRGAVRDWLIALGDTDALIGLDLSTALPFADCGAYFPGWPESPPDMRALWATIDRLAGEEPGYAASRVVAHGELARHFRVQGRAAICSKRGGGACASPNGTRWRYVCSRPARSISSAPRRSANRA